MSRLDEDEQTAVKLLLEAGAVNDIAYNFIEDTGALNGMQENLQFYFDYEALGRDMDINGSFYADENNIIWEYVA